MALSVFNRTLTFGFILVIITLGEEIHETACDFNQDFISKNMATPRQPAMFLAHGGGPLPLMESDTYHTKMKAYMKTAATTLPQKPAGIVLVSAHWEEDVVNVEIGEAPQLVYDYYGFPPETYEIKYSAPGNPALAQRILDALKNAGVPAKGATRGWDHGVFVPLKMMFPDADVPVVAMSLLSSLDPAAHINYGKVLRSLRDENILVIGSGMSFHNMAGFRSNDPTMRKASEEFDAFLDGGLKKENVEERENSIAKWKSGPHATLCHPREEHLLPLHVVVGAAGSDGGSDKSVAAPCTRVYHDPNMLGVTVSSWRFD
eukprot:m.46500 g.46500  ORF g.46500 m.46500 type:complete len:317 (-) comp10378_c0_seq3:77-1027(-)